MDCDTSVWVAAVVQPRRSLPNFTSKTAAPMAGTNAFARKNDPLAAIPSAMVRDRVPADSSLAMSIAGSITGARQIAGMARAPSNPDASPGRPRAFRIGLWPL